MFNQGNESSPTYYASYLSHVDNGTAYRVGHLKVSTGETPGYAAHAHGVAPSKWESISTFPGYGEVPATVTAYPPHPGSLLSLFPRSDGSGSLDLLAWLPGGGGRDQRLLRVRVELGVVDEAVDEEHQVRLHAARRDARARRQL